MKKIILLTVLVSVSLFANNLNELTKKMVNIHKNDIHVEKKLDKPYKIKGYAETEMRLVVSKDKRYILVNNLLDGKYVYLKYVFKPGSYNTAFKTTRVKLITECSTLVSDAYYIDCL